MAYIIDLAILTLRKGIIKRSSKIVCINLLFLVKAVGLTKELTITSSSPPPICFSMNFFIQGNFFSFGKPKKGLVNMTPVILIYGLSIKSFDIINPPIL